MIYYEAEKPERHNGGEFFAHCLEFRVPSVSEGRAYVIEFMKNCDKLKTLDYRFRFIKKYDSNETVAGNYGNYRIPLLIHVCILRFKNKNDAMIFKLQHKN